ncbi:hypothetical protein AJ80_07778 [Polytolypa hystricis UAMH7299]|uniref:Uncharacterized protein n=1 Tax=Polytolypa hystricis (strain UAMH7299) TaxID=1447883 RepID=A0A2B7XII7_POLH7|nr:hypothetical protein AJ80_07778 [Polytolypa hystricis UAMH7299]
MFSRRRKYRPPPPGWTVRGLSYWDCDNLNCDDTFVVGWVLADDGNEGVDTDVIAAGLRRAIRRRAPWVFEWTCCMDKVRLNSDEVPAFSTSADEISGPLKSVISYVENGLPEPVVQVDSNFDPKVLNPRSSASGVKEYIYKNLPLLNLHFIRATDATLVSLSCIHVIMDGVALGRLVTAWQEEMHGINQGSPTTYDHPDPTTLFDFAEEVPVDIKWERPGWIRPSWWEFAKVAAGYYYEAYMYPYTPGTVFLPKELVVWIESVSRRRPKRTIQHHLLPRPPPLSLPLTLLTNTASTYVASPLTTRALRTMTLAEVALYLRASVDPYTSCNSTFITQTIAHQHKWLRSSNSHTSSYPLGALTAQHFGSASLAKTGLGNLEVMTPRGGGRIVESGIGGGTVGPDGESVFVSKSFDSAVTAAVWTSAGTVVFSALANTLSRGLWNGGRIVV